MSLKSHFNEERFQHLWKRAELEEKALVFYYSLFDFTSFEEETDSKLQAEIRNNRKSLIKAIKNVDSNFFHKHDENEFINSASADYFFRYILAWEIKERGIRLKINKGFPDFIDKENHIEVKRLVTTKNLREHIRSILSTKESKNKRCLILIFPMLEEDNLRRAKDFTAGYYCLEEHINCKVEIVFVTHVNMQDSITKILEKIRSLH